MRIEPLKFNDPEIKRQTYVAAFVVTLIDKWDGDKSVDKAIAILHTAGYNAPSIALYVDEAHTKVVKCLAKIIS
jgi:hypothetical protein